MAEERKMVLPPAFLERMKDFLQEEYDDFLAAYENERWYGLRYNPLKMDREAFLRTVPFVHMPVKWASEGFYYRPEEKPGRQTLHEAGAYYIQEPSAMAVVEVLAPEPGEKILDLCAAPGGKSTQIAGRMLGEGLLVSNEIVPNRAKILSQNIERMGIANAVVTGETPERLAEAFPQFFDRILVDAPCSGEGMFRKEENAVNEWSPENVRMCAKRQKKILEQACGMLKPGGILVYSTCTFSVEENEGVINDFLARHEEFIIEETKQEKFFAPGQPKWVENPAPGLEHTMRLWPHKIAGEGHFIARLAKKSGLCPVSGKEPADELHPEGTCAIRISAEGKWKKEQRRNKGNKEREKEGADSLALCQRFLQTELGLSRQAQDRFVQRGTYLSFGEHIYLIPKQMLPLGNLKVIRPGLHIGTNKKNRFEPSHALALYLSPDEVSAGYEMSKEETKRYLRGETFPCDEKRKGWTLLITDGISIGFGKAGGGQMKNHYPKGLRKV